MWDQLLSQIKQGDVKALARTISLVENEHTGYLQLLQELPNSSTIIIGITGAPGAGKSTLTDALIAECISNDKKVGVLCVDPTSPFNLGALLGDRIRMSEWYNNPNVFIRSLATRGSLGGLHPKIIEIADVMKAAPFDVVIIETVGVGQSEIEIAGLADITVVVMVPEGGDEIQTMKSGLMEIADVFVVNKADRPGSDIFAQNLKRMLPPSSRESIPVIKTIASQREGVEELYNLLFKNRPVVNGDKHYWLLAEKAFHLIQLDRMKSVNKTLLKEEIEKASSGDEYFNLYKFVQQHL